MFSYLNLYNLSLAMHVDDHTHTHSHSHMHLPNLGAFLFHFIYIQSISLCSQWPQGYITSIRCLYTSGYTVGLIFVFSLSVSIDTQERFREWEKLYFLHFFLFKRPLLSCIFCRANRRVNMQFSDLAVFYVSLDFRFTLRLGYCRVHLPDKILTNGSFSWPL